MTANGSWGVVILGSGLAGAPGGMPHYMKPGAREREVIIGRVR